MNKRLMLQAGFGELVKRVEALQCPVCKSNVVMDDFTDELSLLEHAISGLCQKCQDETFGKGE